MSAIIAATLFRATWPRSCAKHVANAAGRPVTSAKPWVSARRCPDADTLLHMLASSAALRNELRKVLNAYDPLEICAENPPPSTVACPYGGPDRRASAPRISGVVVP